VSGFTFLYQHHSSNLKIKQEFMIKEEALFQQAKSDSDTL
jgi:hypothetical protein